MLLEHPHAGVRACAALCFRRLPPPAALAPLLLDLEEDLSWLPLHLGGSRPREPCERRKPRCAAALALGQMQVQEQAKAVQELLDDGDWEVRSCALEALAGYSEQDAELVERIAVLLDDDTYAVRAKACSLLGQLKASNQAVPGFIALFSACGLGSAGRDADGQVASGTSRGRRSLGRLWRRRIHLRLRGWHSRIFLRTAPR